MTISCSVLTTDWLDSSNLNTSGTSVSAPKDACFVVCWFILEASDTIDPTSPTSQLTLSEEIRLAVVLGLSF